MDKENIETIYPLTSMQQTLFLHAIQHPESDLGVLQVQFDLRGELNTALMRGAWQTVVNRHQALRTSIFWKNLDQPLQVVQRKIHADLEQLDFAHLEHQQQKVSIAGLCESIRKEGILLGQAPLIRLVIARQSDNLHHFICQCHHIVLDGWSGYLMFRELFELYHVTVTGTFHLLPRPFQYQDFVTWTQQQDLDSAKAYWREALKETGRDIVWPVRISDLDAGYQSKEASINHSLTTQAKTLCSDAKVSLNTLFQALWALIITVFNGKETIAFGVTLSGRTASLDGIENAIGMFSNVLPLCVTVKRNTDLISWLQELASQQVRLNSFDYITMSHIQSWCSTDIRSLFVFENFTHESPFNKDNLSISGYESGMTTNYPVTLSILTDEKLTCRIHYDTDYLALEDAELILENLTNLLNMCLSSPNHSLTSIMQTIDLGQHHPGDNIDLIPLQPMPGVGSQSQTEGLLADLWVEILNMGDERSRIRADQIDRQDNFFDLGGKSIMAALLIARIKEIFQVQLPMYQLLEYSSLAELGEFIEQSQGYQLPSNNIETGNTKPDALLSFTQKHLWNTGNTGEIDDRHSYLSLVSLRPGGIHPPLFCFSAAGNTALTYLNFARHLGIGQPVYGLNPLGLDDNTSPHYSVDEMAAHYLREIRNLQSEGPYYLVGTCFGGNVAFEVACQIQAQGEKVAFLSLIDSTAPISIQGTNRLEYYAKLFSSRRKREGLFNLLLDILVSRQYRRGKHFMERRLNPDKKRLYNLTQAHHVAHISYIPKSYSGDITIYRSSEYKERDKTNHVHFMTSWSSYIDGNLDYDVIPGLHRNMLTGTMLDELADKLKTALEKARISQTG